MDDLSHRFSSQKNRNNPSLSIDNISWSDTMTDSATPSHNTIHPFPTDNDNGESTCIASTPTVKHPIIGDASLDILSDSAHHSKHAMPDVQRDNQRPAQNRMALDFILEGNPPSVDGTPEASVNDHHSTAHVHQSKFGASTEWCPCNLSDQTLEDLNNLSAQCQEQIDIYKKLIEKITAGESRGKPVKSSFERIDDLAQNNNRIEQNVEFELARAKRRHAHIFEHQEQAAERIKEAENKPLRFIANGTKSTIYTIPETFGGYVIVVGPLTAIKQELLNILRVEQAWKKVYNSIWSGPRPYWLRPLILPRVSKFVPTGWTEDLATGLVRPCENLNPRIPEFYDANGDRMSVDCDEYTGIVLSQIRGLADDDHENILRRCYGLEDPEIGEVLSSSDHCVLRIYLGRKSDGGNLDNAEASDVTMEDVDDTSITTTSDYESLSTFNLPADIGHVLKYCKNSRKRKIRVLAAFAREIAFGYAVLHWGARLDARGIEFLLGSSPTGRGKRFYMLDFEDCRPIGELNDRCVRDQLVPAALENDPYIPRAIFYRPNDDGQFRERQARDYCGYDPKSPEDYVWSVFVGDYLEASDKICQAFNRDFDSHLPKLFIEELMKGFLGRRPEQDAKGTVDGATDHPIASDETHDPAEQSNAAESEQGESGSQENPAYDGGDQDDQSRDDSDSFENDQYEDGEYDLDPMSIDVSSEGEEDSDEDDDDDDDDVD